MAVMFAQKTPCDPTQNMYPFQFPLNQMQPVNLDTFGAQDRKRTEHHTETNAPERNDWLQLFLNS